MNDPRSPGGEGTPTLRAVVLGLLSVVLLCWAVPWTDIYYGTSELAGSHFPIGPFLILIALAAGANLLLPRISGRLRLDRAELATIYCMVLAAAGIPTYGLVAYLLPAVTAADYYNDAANNWAELLSKPMPPWLRPLDPAAIKGLYEGSKGAGIPWGAWIVPLCYWTIFALAIFGLMFCLTAIIRRQWIEKERLAFPLVDLQLEMIHTEPDGRHPLFHNRLFWIAAAAVFLIHSLNALQAYESRLPTIPLQTYLNFPDNAWPLSERLNVYFSVIGFGFLLTTEVAFSVWFFFWIHKLQDLIAFYMGAWTPYVRVRESQYIGAFVVFVLFMLWRARGHLWEVIRKAISGESDPKEAMSYRFAVLGAIIAIAVLGAWCVASGISPLVFAAVLAIFLLICFGLTRIVIETGVFSAKVTQMMPLKLIVPAVGTAPLGAGNLVMVSVIQYVFMYDLKTFLMPALMHGQRVADKTGTNARRLFGAVALAVLVAIVVSYASNLFFAYRVGGRNMIRGSWFYQSGPTGSVCRQVATWLNQPEGTDLGKIASCGAGALFTTILILLRQHLAYWPIHPIGYIIAFSYETTRVWFSFMLGWLVKVCVMKFGAGTLYRRVRYLFLGFILGELGAAGFWIIVDLVMHKQGHVVFP